MKLKFLSINRLLPGRNCFISPRRSLRITIPQATAPSQKMQAWLENRLQCRKVLLTHSCTAALEMAALLADIQDGDEVIMPSYTFVSTANAFVLRGGVPVFIDIRCDTLNMDETWIEKAITKRTKAILPVHYAGVSCAMDEINHIAQNTVFL